MGGWGRDFFTINEAGNVQVTPAGPGSLPIDLKDLVDQLIQRGIELPILLRFTDILRHRIGEMHDAFTAAIADSRYQAGYIAAYPMKVNQQRQVVEEHLNFGQPFRFFFLDGPIAHLANI